MKARRITKSAKAAVFQPEFRSKKQNSRKSDYSRKGKSRFNNRVYLT